MKIRSGSHKARLIALALVLLVALMAAGSVWAASPAPQQVGDTALENLLIRERLAFDDQTKRLQAANAVIDAAATWIDRLKAAGKDTSALDSALATYKTQIGAAQADHDAGGSVLSAHAGFGANGKVTDRKAALDTIKSAGKSLRQAHLTLVQSTLDFRTAVLNWRAANR
jgi:hypothetical protein